MICYIKPLYFPFLFFINYFYSVKQLALFRVLYLHVVIVELIAVVGLVNLSGMSEDVSVMKSRVIVMNNCGRTSVT